MKLSRPLAATAAAALFLVLPLGASASVEVVTKRPVVFTHFTTIQAAVDHAAPGDWVVIDKGVYPESVTVKTPNLHIRGVDRNKVILDGRHRAGANGIEVLKADNVWIENLTARNFDRSASGEDGNQIWWNGGDGSGQIGLHGWWGSYLTAYSTGKRAEYGIFTSNAVTGAWSHDYASGFADAGFYLGACRDCQARITHIVAERNALGYSGTNSGGRILIANSIFRGNSSGIVPNSLNNDDIPPPQDGACDSGSNTNPTPFFTTTRIARCTVIRDNVVEHNDNLRAPAHGASLQVPWGNGIFLIGTGGDLVTHNVVRDNPNNGLFGLENPDPFPPAANTLYFQLSGNRISANRFVHNGYNPKNKLGVDIALAGGLFGAKQSVDNCVSANRFRSSSPKQIERRWGCSHATTPNPGGVLLGEVLDLQTQSERRHQRAQPAPRPQPTMPRPCAGVPPNPLCAG